MPAKLRYKSTLFDYLHRNGGKTKITITAPKKIIDSLIDSGLGLNEVFCQGVYRLLQEGLLDLPGINVQEHREALAKRLQKPMTGRYSTIDWK